MPSIEVLIGLVALLLAVRYYVTRNYDYWKKRRVPGPEPVALFGTMKDVRLSKVHIADYTKSVYDSYPDEPAVGLFAGTEPALLIKDLDMIKDALVKSFVTFPDRGVKIHVDIEPLAQHLLFLEYERWKPMRRKLAPTFTSGKLKEMFYLVNECADHFADYLENLASKNEPIECRELTAKFTTDVIGVCVFGLNMNALADEDSEFRKIGRRIFADSWFTRLKLLSRFLPHWAVVPFKSFLQDEHTDIFFINTVTSTMEYRKKNNIRRHDFIDLLMDIRDHPEQVGEEEISDVILTAQAFVFFLAGFETSSTTISNAMYELALNPDIQDNLRQEVKVAFQENNGKLSYDVIKNMKYLDKVFRETLRKYPPVGMLQREAVSDHIFADSNISITKGTKIFVPVYAIHYDPNIYPDPNKFDPERFEEDAVESRPHMTYLPFGDGPRICIGERFAHIQTKLGLATVIRHFKLEVCEKTCKQYEKQTGLILIAPKSGLYLRITKL
ncbi:probable cytochrome P450 6a13 [Phymastichus coffea]|uniref:probable cytochrome P450 6a13 n=1 Tax=Phymastichus coffea TaxID=108790 RepID=UPI00273AA966|nr:probable cytochrome P450 6a13 [Phymastichus coffea]